MRPEGRVAMLRWRVANRLYLWVLDPGNRFIPPYRFGRSNVRVRLVLRLAERIVP